MYYSEHQNNVFLLNGLLHERRSEQQSDWPKIILDNIKDTHNSSSSLLYKVKFEVKVTYIFYKPYGDKMKCVLFFGPMRKTTEYTVCIKIIISMESPHETCVHMCVC